MQEIETEYLQTIVENPERCAIKVQIIVNDEFRISETVETLKQIEGQVQEADFFVYCPSLFNQIKIDEPDPKHNSLAVAAGVVVHSMHLDTLPYSSVIVSVPKGAEEKLKEICTANGAVFEVIQNL